MCVKNLKIEPAARAVQRERPSVQTSRGTNETISLEREKDDNHQRKANLPATSDNATHFCFLYNEERMLNQEREETLFSTKKLD